MTIDAYLSLLEKQSCQISTKSDLKRRSLRVFKEVRPNKNNNNNMTSNTGSVPDPK